MRRGRGWTLIELVIVIAICGIMASGIAAVFVPQIESYFHTMGSTTLQSAAARGLRILVEGDAKARGLRFADPNSPITAAGASSLTYRYFDLYQTSADTPHEVTLSYDPSNRVITRTIDGGAPDYVPYFVKPGGVMAFDPLGGALFRYYDSADSELSEPVALGSISRVDIGIEADYLHGIPAFGGAKTRLKTGVFIKRNA